MRKRYCKGRYYKAGAYHNFEIGKFHQWGSNYEEFENGAGNYSVAIVELPDGTVVMPVADDICFLESIYTGVGQKYAQSVQRPCMHDYVGLDWRGRSENNL